MYTSCLHHVCIMAAYIRMSGTNSGTLSGTTPTRLCIKMCYPYLGHFSPLPGLHQAAYCNNSLFARQKLFKVFHGNYYARRPAAACKVKCWLFFHGITSFNKRHLIIKLDSFFCVWYGIYIDSTAICPLGNGCSQNTCRGRGYALQWHFR